MADSRSYTKPSPFSPQQLRQVKNTNSTNAQKNSYAQIFCKSTLFLIFLVAIPLFPSQAPNFIRQSLLTKFWEIVHLLFIGVAVSYGLFSRRNVEVDFETQVNNNTFDDSQSSYVSRIFHVSPIFDDGSENQSGCDEKNVYPSYYDQSWNSSQFYRGESTAITGMDNSSSGMIDESSKIGSLNSENQTTQIENDENSNVVQAWSSQYYQGESMVVLSEANYAIDDWGRHEQVVGRYRPLGLPVRSLKSRIRKVESSQFSNINGNDLDSNLIGVSCHENHFGDMGPMKLEEKFDENPSSLPSQVPWQQQPRSGRTEMWENLGPFSNVPSHFRPLSADETQFESLKSHSFRSATSFSSQASSVSDSPAEHSPSHYTSSSDSPNSKGEEESGKEREYRASYPPAASQSPQATLNREVRLNAFHLRRYSSGSLFQKDLHIKTLKDELKDHSGKRKEDPSSSSLSRKQKAQVLLKSDTKAATVSKALLRGKSVRTIRGIVYKAEAMKDAEINGIHMDEQVGEGSKEAKARNIEKKNEMNVEVESQKEVGGLDKRKKKNKNFDDRWKIELRKEGGHDNISIGGGNIEKKNEMEGEVESQKELGGLDKMKKKKKNLDDRWKLEWQKEGGNDNMPTSINRKDVETREDQDAPNKTYPKYQNQEKNEFFEKVIVETTDESESEAEPDKEDAATVTPAASISRSNAGNDDPNEVDKKAGEFIAKFREQIRLQKVASIGRSNGPHMSGKHFR